MSTPTFTPEETIVHWYYSPMEATSTDKPDEPFDHPVATIAESIDLTMRYLTATNPPLGRGGIWSKVRTVEKPDGTMTLFWPIYEVREDTKVQLADGSTRSDIFIWYYGFDANHQLMLETVEQLGRENTYKRSYSWPDEASIPVRDNNGINRRKKLLEKLQAARLDLSQL